MKSKAWRQGSGQPWGILLGDEWLVKSSKPPEVALTNHQFQEINCLIAQKNYFLASIAWLQIDHTRMTKTSFALPFVDALRA
jgi:hypothetical protein